jgi:hypothetical protein
MSKRFLAITALLIACMSAVLAFGGSSAAAQDEEATYNLQIDSGLCEESPCGEENAEFISGVTAYVTSTDGTIDYGSCTTDYETEPGGCTVAVDPGTSVEVTVDESTIPEGYVALDYPIVYDVPAEQSEAGDVAIYFSPQQDTVDDEAAAEGEEAAAAEGDEVEASAEGTPVEAAASELPATGSGSNGGGVANLPMLLLGAVAAFGVLASGLILGIRRVQR